MTINEIKTAVDKGIPVYWLTLNYMVIKDSLNQYMIKSLSNNHCIGLTWDDGMTLNGKENDFFIGH